MPPGPPSRPSPRASRTAGEIVTDEDGSGAAALTGFLVSKKFIWARPGTSHMSEVRVVDDHLDGAIRILRVHVVRSNLRAATVATAWRGQA